LTTASNQTTSKLKIGLREQLQPEKCNRTGERQKNRRWRDGLSGPIEARKEKSRGGDEKSKKGIYKPREKDLKKR